MKKGILLLLAVLLALLPLVNMALAEDFEPVEPAKQSNLPSTFSFDNPGEIKAGVFYNGVGSAEYQLVFYPQETGTYTFYIRSKGTADASFRITDKYDTTIYSVYSNARVPQITKLDLTAGKEYRIHDTHHIYWCICTNDFCFAICSPSTHAGELSGSKVVKAATCTELGIMAKTCTLCGGEADRTEIPATGHTPGEEEILLKATCIAEGAKGTKCTTCGEILTREPIPMTDHTVGKMVQTVTPTCTTAGRGEQRCTVCNTLLNTEEIAPFGHIAGAWVDLKAATCTEDGQRVQRCSQCGETMNTETVAALGHSPMDWQITREATCLESGLREKKCAFCGLSVEQEEIPALGHSYTEWETTKEATKDEEGERIRHCIHCGDTQTETIEKIPKFLGIF